MVAAKGGVWTNIEDEILKAAISKYGLNQWARVSSLLARKTPKQCKARWTEWLDPNIKKIEWSKEEDEKLLHLAKLMPTQWRTIAPIVGRTATQCLERYQKLLDDAEARENEDFGLAGPEGGETSAPTADDVRRLRPGELDPDPESKPARPDTIDLDEDEKEMLSEARARLANTQGKKAKRKARERQLEESRRLAVLQKRRELKNAGINIRVVTRKKGEMDYNADIPFEHEPAPGFYDTQDEAVRNEKQREAYDPRKQQLALKRRGDPEDEGNDQKKRKGDKGGGQNISAAAAKAAQMQKIREAEQRSKRKALVLPSPQVGDGELEEIVKMGMADERATKTAGGSENEATRGLIGNYSGIVGSTPIRTPMAPKEEDRVANEVRNAIARTGTQSALLGGENTPLYEGESSTGFGGVAPSQQQIHTPNPLATPLRQGGVGIGSTPMRNGAGPGATPMRTPRDNFRLNQENAALVAQTPRDLRLYEKARRQDLMSKLASLPRPTQTDWEFEIPEDQEEENEVELSEEDAAVRDRRNEELRKAAEVAEFRRQTQVVQRGLPRPPKIDIDALIQGASQRADPVARQIAIEAAHLIANDALKFGGSQVKGDSRPVEIMDEEVINKAKIAVAAEVGNAGTEPSMEDAKPMKRSMKVLGLDAYDEDEVDEHELISKTFENVQDQIAQSATKSHGLEKKLALHLGGYQQRSKALRKKIGDTHETLEKAKMELSSLRTLQQAEEEAIPRRLDALREEVAFISRRERQAQDLYRARKDELDGLEIPNGYH
ncbi:hypothetical protein NA57DRAFT_45505 [Rhizodiscina lignyota]|uniref:Pre-mRNA-splicing factor cef1 n=1 Tax=Rhizodiscina lignyota TaxID=1504668 RepID=A0A9P4I9J3_9PEZI|nr:hypothetical protein NA57DRAFT_45505 [Rhizodiscina lignyota]